MIQLLANSAKLQRAAFVYYDTCLLFNLCNWAARRA